MKKDTSKSTSTTTSSNRGGTSQIQKDNKSVTSNSTSSTVDKQAKPTDSKSK